jgi:hypothetical protein
MFSDLLGEVWNGLWPYAMCFVCSVGVALASVSYSVSLSSADDGTLNRFLNNLRYPLRWLGQPRRDIIEGLSEARDHSSLWYILPRIVLSWPPIEIVLRLFQTPTTTPGQVAGRMILIILTLTTLAIAWSFGHTIPKLNSEFADMLK